MKDALALALVHFIWQGALLGMMGAILIRLAKTPSIRYAVGIVTMVAMLAAPALTFVAVTAGESAVADSGTRSLATAGQAAITLADPGMAITAASEATTQDLRVPTTWILGFWGLGVAVLSLRLIGGWAVARQVATHALTPVGAELQHMAAEVALRLNVRRAVRVCASASLAVPIMIGWLRPVIVLPSAVMAALPLAQLEALLAHELAHIRRHDYAVNLLQSVVETVCFYHPAVWWMSHEVRRQREQCCDDIAVGVCDRLTYVSALSALASLAPPRLALAATGGSLRDRVRRLVEPTSHSSAKGGWMAMFPILLVVSIVAPQAWDAQAVPPVTQPPTVAVEQAKPAPATVPSTPIQIEVRPRVRPSVAPSTARMAPRVVVPREPVQLERRVAARRPVEVVVPRPTPAMTRRAVRPVERQVAATESAQVRAARRQRERTVAVAQLAALEMRLRQEEMTVARQRELAERGLSTREAATAAELQVAKTRLEVEALRELHVLNQREVRIRNEAAAVSARYDDTVRAAAEARALSVLDPEAIVQAQDRLTIAIAGEPDLPTAFTVSADGAIRFPFLGSIRVQGSTARQVQSVIQKLIADKGLAQNPSVSVSVRRVRGR